MIKLSFISSDGLEIAFIKKLIIFMLDGNISYPPWILDPKGLTVDNVRNFQRGDVWNASIQWHFQVTKAKIGYFISRQRLSP